MQHIIAAEMTTCLLIGTGMNAVSLGRVEVVEALQLGATCPILSTLCAPVVPVHVLPRISTELLYLYYYHSKSTYVCRFVP